MPASRPYQQFNFQVTLSGPGADTALGGFSEMSGMSTSVEVTEYRAGASPEKPLRKVLPGHKAGDVRLKRGVVNSGFFAWLKQSRGAGKMARDVKITLCDEKNRPVLRWVVQQAWPEKITGPALSADANEIAIEELVLSHEGIVTA